MYNKREEQLEILHGKLKVDRKSRIEQYNALNQELQMLEEVRFLSGAVNADDLYNISMLDRRVISSILTKLESKGLIRITPLDKNTVYMDTFNEIYSYIEQLQNDRDSIFNEVK